MAIQPVEAALRDPDFEEAAWRDPAVARVMNIVRDDHNTPTDPKTGLLWAQPFFDSAKLRGWLAYDQGLLFEASPEVASDQRQPADRNDAGLFVAAFIDGDGYKSINYTHGHDGGDAAIISLADNLRRIFRPDDFVLRYGGDEFVVLMKNFSPNKIEGFRSAVNERLRKITLSVGKISITGSATMGLDYCPMAQVRPNNASPASYRDVISQAERALVAAKEERNHSVQYKT